MIAKSNWKTSLRFGCAHSFFPTHSERKLISGHFSTNAGLRGEARTQAVCLRGDDQKQRTDGRTSLALYIFHGL